MNYLANIYTKSKLDIEPFFNVVDDENKLIDGIPTLIIGWDSVKSLYGDINILDKKVKDNIYWTFGKRERRNVMEKNKIKNVKEVQKKSNVNCV